MKTETLKSKPLIIRNDDRPFNGSLRTFDLPTLIEKMKRENTWDKGGLNAKILMNKPNKQIVLTVLHKGTEINSFQSNDSITIQVIEGELKFHTQNESITLEKDQMLTLQENIDYSLTTKAETVLLFTIIKQILQPATI